MIRKFGMAALAACTISALATTMGWSADKPVFGLVMSFSGWFAPIDADTIAGAKLAVAEINAAGGVLGQPIEVVEFDNKSEPPLGADGAVDVIGKGAKAILFPSDFDFGAPGAYVAQQKDVIAFSGASDPKFGVQGVGPLAYSTSNASQAQGALMAEWALQAEGLEDRLRPSRQHHRLHQVAVRQLRHALDRTRRQGGAARPGHIPQQRSLDRRAGDAHHLPEQEARSDLLLLLRARRSERYPAVARRRHQCGDPHRRVARRRLLDRPRARSQQFLRRQLRLEIRRRPRRRRSTASSSASKPNTARRPTYPMGCAATRPCRPGPKAANKAGSLDGREGGGGARYFRQGAARDRTDHLHQSSHIQTTRPMSIMGATNGKFCLRRPLRRGVFPPLQ